VDVDEVVVLVDGGSELLDAAISFWMNIIPKGIMITNTV
jgi:hypothetical protein